MWKGGARPRGQGGVPGSVSFTPILRATPWRTHKLLVPFSRERVLLLPQTLKGALKSETLKIKLNRHSERDLLREIFLHVNSLRG